MTLILADTSVWINHFRVTDPMFTQIVAGDALLMHPIVIGELSMGNLPARRELLAQMGEMDEVVQASGSEVLGFVERHHLHGLGLGWVDANLLVSTLLTPGCRLWTRDRRLNTVADTFGRAAHLHN